MSKTFKFCGIFLSTVVMLLVFRIVSSFISAPDNIFSWVSRFVFQVVFLGLMPYVLYRIFMKKDTRAYLHDMRVSVKINPLSYLLAVVIAVFVFYLNLVTSSFTQIIFTGLGFTYASGASTIFHSPEVLILEILTGALLPAIFEEIADRGLLLAALNDSGWSDRQKILLVGILFGLVHQNITQMPSAVVGGLVFTYMAVKCRSVVPSMIAHFLNNTFVTLYSFSGQKSGWFKGIVDHMFNLTFNNMLNLFIMLVAGVALLAVLLVQLKKINLLNRATLEPLPPTDRIVSPEDIEKIQTELRHIFLTVEHSAEDDFNEIFGQEKREEKREEKPYPTLSPELVKAHAALAKKRRAHIKDFLLLGVGILITFATTIITFVWGFLR